MHSGFRFLEKIGRSVNELGGFLPLGVGKRKYNPQTRLAYYNGGT